jgi:multidrug efflux pump
LFFVPSFGAMLKHTPAPGVHVVTEATETDVLAEARDNFAAAKGTTRVYLNVLQQAINRPFTVLGYAIAFQVGVMVLFDLVGKGVEFFPSIEPEIGQLNIHARGDLAVMERDALVREVEQRILDMP